MGADGVHGDSGARIPPGEGVGLHGGVAPGQYVDARGEDLAGFPGLLAEDEVDVYSTRAHDAEHSQRAGRGFGEPGSAEHPGAAVQHGDLASSPRSDFDQVDAVGERAKPGGADGERAGQDQERLVGHGDGQGGDEPAGLSGCPGVEPELIGGRVRGQIAVHRAVSAFAALTGSCRDPLRRCQQRSMTVCSRSRRAWE
ncbi:hypothetical protein FHR32_001083 [Streptosporangium album]|uniref:Uncharacterized protein n=1 Tax=Streptosporangium album TaxID=47479 RepID=A0A7W7W7F2_9ACTN|nr:hypothetical protein [Streptosporangium album]MBB4936778.1 hypothetical protein [Streptosporangium album]